MGRLTQLAINDEGFIFDPATGESYTVNRTGLAVLRHLKEGMDQNALAAALQARFEVSADVAERDVAAMVDYLRAASMV